MEALGLTHLTKPLARTLPDELRGIVTVLNTPFTEDDRIDLQSLEQNVIRACEAGVAGFLVPALAGEVGQLRRDERVAMVRTVLETVRLYGERHTPTERRISGEDGYLPPKESARQVHDMKGGRAVQWTTDLEGTPESFQAPIGRLHGPWVIGGATAQDKKERVAAAEALLELGCDGILAWIPYTTDGQYEQEVRELASLKPPFLMLQDWDPSGPGLPIELIRRLFEEVEEFKALKIETMLAGPKYTAVLKATRGMLHVSGGWAVTQMIEALDRGVHAFMPTGMHEIYCEIFRRYATGNREGATDLFRKILPVLAFSNQHLDISILFFKRLLWREGTYTTPRCRKLQYQWDEYQERIADELIQLAVKLRLELDKVNPADFSLSQ